MLLNTTHLKLKAPVLKISDHLAEKGFIFNRNQMIKILIFQLVMIKA